MTSKKSSGSVGRRSQPSAHEERYRLFQGILQSTSDGILAVNRENEVLFPMARALLGRGEVDLLRQRLEEAGPPHES